MNRNKLREIIENAVWWGAREWDACAIPAAREAADRAMKQIEGDPKCLDITPPPKDADPKHVALHFMKHAARDVFRLCAQSAEDLAASVESGTLPMDAANALRLLASMFRASAER